MRMRRVEPERGGPMTKINERCMSSTGWRSPGALGDERRAIVAGRSGTGEVVFSGRLLPCSELDRGDLVERDQHVVELLASDLRHQHGRRTDAAELPAIGLAVVQHQLHVAALA